MCEYRRNGVHIWSAGHIDGKPAVLLRDLFGNIGYSAQDCKISVIVTGSLSGYKPKFSFHLYPYKLGE